MSQIPVSVCLSARLCVCGWQTA